MASSMRSAVTGSFLQSPRYHASTSGMEAQFPRHAPIITYRSCPGQASSGSDVEPEVWLTRLRKIRAWSRGDPPGVREAEAGISGRAAGQCGGENASGCVVIVVYLCGFLAWVGAKDASGVLDEPPFPPDRGREKQGSRSKLRVPMGGLTASDSVVHVIKRPRPLSH